MQTFYGEQIGIKTIIEPLENQNITLPKQSGFTASYSLNSYQKVAELINEGYKCITIQCIATGTNQAYEYQLSYFEGATGFTIQLKNTGELIKVTPVLKFIMARGL